MTGMLWAQDFPHFPAGTSLYYDPTLSTQPIDRTRGDGGAGVSGWAIGMAVVAVRCPVA